MASPIAQLLVLAFLIPAGAVFVLAYRHALRSWLATSTDALPTAVVAGHHAALHRGELARRFHAALIAMAFASVFIMGLVALAMVVTAIVVSAS